VGISGRVRRQPDRPDGPRSVLAVRLLGGQRRAPRRDRPEVGAEVFNRCRELLRVYDTGSWRYFDIPTDAGARSWYIKVPEPNRTTASTSVS